MIFFRIWCEQNWKTVFKDKLNDTGNVSVGNVLGRADFGAGGPDRISGAGQLAQHFVPGHGRPARGWPKPMIAALGAGATNNLVAQAINRSLQAHLSGAAVAHGSMVVRYRRVLAGDRVPPAAFADRWCRLPGAQLRVRPCELRWP